MKKENTNEASMKNDNLTADERRKRAMKVREELSRKSQDKDYCTRCMPHNKETKGVHIIGKGILCPHGKTFAPKV